MGHNSWFLPSAPNSATASPNSEAMDVFGYDKAFPSVQKGSNTKELEKRVRSMSMLTPKKAVPACLAVPFDAKNPLPEVSDF
jgi:hypothetical protein